MKQDPMYLEHSFDLLVQAIDALPDNEEINFLSRLALILAEEIKNSAQFDYAIQRALLASKEAAL